jgi:hypothetical protein
MLGVLASMAVPGMETPTGFRSADLSHLSPAATVQRLTTARSRLHKRNPTLSVQHRTQLLPEMSARSMCPAWLLALTPIGGVIMMTF